MSPSHQDHLHPSQEPGLFSPAVCDVQAFLGLRFRQIAPDAVLAQAWDVFYATHSAVVRRLVNRYQTPPAETDDLVQEVWVRVIKKLPELRWAENQSGLRAWLYKVVHDKAIDLARRRRRQAAASLGDPQHEKGDLPGPLVDETDPGAVFAECWQREMAEELLHELKTELSAENFGILRSHFLDGRTVPEIAAALGLRVGQVEGRIHRMLKKLRRRMAAYTGSSL